MNRIYAGYNNRICVYDYARTLPILVIPIKGLVSAFATFNDVLLCGTFEGTFSVIKDKKIVFSRGVEGGGITQIEVKGEQIFIACRMSTEIQCLCLKTLTPLFSLKRMAMTQQRMSIDAGQKLVFGDTDGNINVYSLDGKFEKLMKVSDDVVNSVSVFGDTLAYTTGSRDEESKGGILEFVQIHNNVDNSIES